MKKAVVITLESGQKITCPAQTMTGELLTDLSVWIPKLDCNPVDTNELSDPKLALPDW